MRSIAYLAQTIVVPARGTDGSKNKSLQLPVGEVEPLNKALGLLIVIFCRHDSYWTSD